LKSNHFNVGPMKRAIKYDVRKKVDSSLNKYCDWSKKNLWMSSVLIMVPIALIHYFIFACLIKMNVKLFIGSMQAIMNQYGHHNCSSYNVGVID
jgi:hypothetical protein